LNVGVCREGAKCDVLSGDFNPTKFIELPDVDVVLVLKSSGLE